MRYRLPGPFRTSRAFVVVGTNCLEEVCRVCCAVVASRCCCCCCWLLVLADCWCGWCWRCCRRVWNGLGAFLLYCRRCNDIYYYCIVVPATQSVPEVPDAEMGRTNGVFLQLDRTRFGRLPLLRNVDLASTGSMYVCMCYFLHALIRSTNIIMLL